MFEPVSLILYAFLILATIVILYLYFKVVALERENKELREILFRVALDLQENKPNNEIAEGILEKLTQINNRVDTFNKLATKSAEKIVNRII